MPYTFQFLLVRTKMSFVVRWNSIKPYVLCLGTLYDLRPMPAASNFFATLSTHAKMNGLSFTALALAR